MFSSKTVDSFLCDRIPAGSRLLVAVSGGPDSVALLHLLKGCSYDVVVGHVDHAMRRGSSADARFVKRLAAAWDLPAEVVRKPVRPYARSNGLGLEEAARMVRYQALGQIAEKVHAQAVLTAHTLDDQAETVLMNFLRGAGPSGLAGIPEQRPLQLKGSLPLLRPLLGVPKSILKAYLRSHGIPSRQDPTNRSTRFTRNRIRHELLPLLESSHGGLRERLVQSAAIFREEERFWDDQVSRKLPRLVRRTSHGWTVVLTKLFGYHRALIRRIFRHLLPGVTFQDIEQIHHLANNTTRKGVVMLSGGWTVRRRGNALMAMRKRI